MKGRGSKVDQSWICCGVPAGSPARDCSSLLYKEGSACRGRHKCLHWGLKKEVANLEARRERILFGVARPSHFGDQTLILGLWSDLLHYVDLCLVPSPMFIFLSLFILTSTFLSFSITYLISMTWLMYFGFVIYYATSAIAIPMIMIQCVSLILHSLH